MELYLWSGSYEWYPPSCCMIDGVEAAAVAVEAAAEAVEAAASGESSAATDAERAAAAAIVAEQVAAGTVALASQVAASAEIDAAITVQTIEMEGAEWRAQQSAELASLRSEVSFLTGELAALRLVLTPPPSPEVIAEPEAIAEVVTPAAAPDGGAAESPAQKTRYARKI